MVAYRTMRTAVAASFKASTAITEADAGAQFLALSYADAIDMARKTALEDPAGFQKALFLGPHIINALRALGCTPDGREQAGPDAHVDPAAAALASLQAEGAKPRK